MAAQSAFGTQMASAAQTPSSGGGGKRAKTRKRALLLIAGLVVVVIGIVLVNKKYGGPAAAKVYAAQVERGTIEATVSGPGYVVPEKQVKISSGVMGRIVHLAVREGQMVSEGDLLLQIDSTQYAARVREVEGSLEGAQSYVRLQEVRLEKLEMELQRQRQLRSDQLVSEKEIQSIEADVKVARAELASARHGVTETEARLASTRDDLRKTTIVSPLAGIVSSLDVEEGEIAIVGTMNYAGTILMTISDLSQMEVEAEIDETDVLDIVLGQKAKVYVDALGDSTLAGTVIDIASSAHTKGSGTVEEATNFWVRVRIGGGLKTLKPGMSANVEIRTATKTDVLSLPIQAVVRREFPHEGDSTEPDSLSGAEKEKTEGAFVVEEGKAVFRAIETGISDETDIVVVSGLEEGDRVVTGPYKVLARLETDHRVRVVEEERDTNRADRD